MELIRSYRGALLLVAGACASPHLGERQTRVAVPGEIAGSNAPVTITDADACASTPLAPGFEADGNGARAALPRSSFEDCSPIDLDGKPPCEVACTVVAPAPDFRSGDDGRSPNFHMLGHTVYFATSPAKEVGRIVTYDGPLDAISAQHAADRSTVEFVDHLTSPPTLELRSGSCLFQCSGKAPLAPLGGTPTGKSESDCRTACPPMKRYRYDGKRLQPMR